MKGSNAKVLVTGAAGLIGSHMVDALLARGHVDGRATFVHGSILDVFV